MKSVIYSAVALAAFASAQTTTTTAASSSSTCLAQPILEQCLVTTLGYIDLCATTDYQCLCDKYTAVLTCFGNCPNDSREPQYSQLKQLNCMNASIYSSLSTATATKTSASGSATAATTTTESSSGTTTTGTSTGTGTTTASATGASQSNAAGELVGSVPGAFAAIAGVVVALL